MQMEFVVNGRTVSLEIGPHELLSEVLRERLGLTGTHIGCDTSQCGACVVHLDGVSVKSCSVLAATIPGAKVTTIEGIGSAGSLHPMQEAFHLNHGLQCGFCTPGMIMSAIDLAAHNPDPSDPEVRQWLCGNYCRCTGYQNIVASVRAGAAAMRTQIKGG